MSLTISQLVNNKRKKKIKKIKLKNLEGNPFKKGVCLKIFLKNPKKPNSGLRKTARVRLSNKQKITAAIPGLGHDLIQYSTVLVRGGRAPDVPGVKYKLVRNKYDFTKLERIDRSNRRSKFGKKRSLLN
jgi:small subunit ribosomal protein S12